MNTRGIYLDYAATTPVDPLVHEAMLPFLGGETFGNPSSVHRFGQDARRAVDAARDALAASLGCDTSEVYFTSGGTEADNTAVLGVLLANRARGDHLVTTTIEHHAVLDVAAFAEKSLGFRVTCVPVGEDGVVDVEAVADAITDRTTLVSVMHANNEIGTIQPVEEIAKVCRIRGVAFHTDAVQTLGHLPFDVDELGVDLLTVSAHKIYGPKGVGALYVRKGTRFTPWLHGGQQEREKRAGTENVAGVVGFGKAVDLLASWRDAEAGRLARLRDDFLADVLSRVPDARLNGDAARRLPNNVNLSFPGADGEALLLHLDLHGVAASSGSACASGSIEPSHVLRALGLPLPLARAAVRFSLGRGTTPDDLGHTAEIIAEAVRDVRANSG
jgi:cysteine desulfurase